MTDFRHALDAELEEAAAQAAQARAGDDQGAILAALDRVANLYDACSSVRLDATEHAKELIRQALRAGVDYRLLFDRPLSAPIVRGLAKELGIEVAKGGPSVRRPPRGASPRS